MVTGATPLAGGQYRPHAHLGRGAAGAAGATPAAATFRCPSRPPSALVARAPLARAPLARPLAARPAAGARAIGDRAILEQQQPQPLLAAFLRRRRRRSAAAAAATIGGGSSASTSSSSSSGSLLRPPSSAHSSSSSGSGGGRPTQQQRPLPPLRAGPVIVDDGSADEDSSGVVATRVAGGSPSGSGAHSTNGAHAAAIAAAAPDSALAKATAAADAADRAATAARDGLAAALADEQRERRALLDAAAAPGGGGLRARVAAQLASVPHRWRLVAMIAVSFVLCNMDKVNMSVAVIPMARDLGWTATDRGLVSSSFFWGYSLTQIPAGWISTRVGGARVLAAGVALWSFGTLVAPPAAHHSLGALCASRVLVGLGEGFAPSAAVSVLAAQVPSAERARAVTTVWGGLDVGSAVGLLLSGPLIRMYGWPSVFYLFAVLGGIWCLLWPLFRPERPDRVSEAEARVQAAEKLAKKARKAADAEASAASAGSEADAAEQRQAAKKARAADARKAAAARRGRVPWGEFMRSPPVWAVTVAHFCFNWGYYTLLAWLPSYFEAALGVSVQSSSLFTLVPYVAMTAMTPLVGPVADGWVKRGMSLTRARKLCQGIAFVGPAACMLACAALTPAPGGAPLAAGGGTAALLVLLLSLGFALGAWSRAGLYCNHQDLSPKYASALLGITNTAGAIPGVLGVTSAGYLLDATGSWALALFLPTAACQLFGAAVYTALASSERQDWV
jgi:ACS family sodium-dependent inorganic phosphate cotransporter